MEELGPHIYETDRQLYIFRLALHMSELKHILVCVSGGGAYIFILSTSYFNFQPPKQGKNLKVFTIYCANTMNSQQPANFQYDMDDKNS
jgi:hypothetical protein